MIISIVTLSESEESRFMCEEILHFVLNDNKTLMYNRTLVIWGLSIVKRWHHF